MPEDVDAALREHGALTACRARLAYQRNDYVGWIGKARKQETRRKRLDQMLSAPRKGDVDMRMAWSSGGD